MQRDREFEPCSLQRRAHREPDFLIRVTGIFMPSPVRATASTTLGRKLCQEAIASILRDPDSVLPDSVARGIACTSPAAPLAKIGCPKAPALGPGDLRAAGQRGSSRSVVGRTSERTIACA